MPGEKFTIYMDIELKKELKKTAIDEGTNASAIITELVIKYLNEKKNAKK
jgi:metal-responsive CopG/Arc/MetJ family transcriptional regulator